VLAAEKTLNSSSLRVDREDHRPVGFTIGYFSLVCIADNFEYRLAQIGYVTIVLVLVFSHCMCYYNGYTLHC
jgi:hypothetical protein